MAKYITFPILMNFLKKKLKEKIKSRENLLIFYLTLHESQKET